jgi:hypothetical protein
MRQILTAKLNVQTTPTQLRSLCATQMAWRDALSYVSRYAFAHGEMSHVVGWQDGTYQEFCARVGHPAQRACSVPRQVDATDKSLWITVKAGEGPCQGAYGGADEEALPRIGPGAQAHVRLALPEISTRP